MANAATPILSLLKSTNSHYMMVSCTEPKYNMMTDFI